MTKLFALILILSILIGILVIIPGNVKAEIGNVIKSFSAPEGTQPNGLVWDGSNLWMSSYMINGGIYKLSPVDGSVLGEYKLTDVKYDRYGALTYDGIYLWVADSYGNEIYQLNTSDCSIISNISIPEKNPDDLTWDGGYLWLYGSTSKLLFKINPVDSSLVDSYSPTGVETQEKTGLTYAGGYLWMSGTNKIIKLDPSDFTEIDSFYVPCLYPEGLTWDGKYLWCISFDKKMIYQIDIGILAPLAPQNLLITPYEGYVELRWNAPDDDGGSLIMRYNIYRSTTSGIEKKLQTTVSNEVSFTDNNVINGQVYYYQVSAENSAGEGEKSNKEKVTLTSGVTTPSSPQGLTGSGGNGYVELKWNEPNDNGGSSIIRYNIYRSTTSGTRKKLMKIIGNRLSFTDDNVTNNCKYYYEISAENSAGEGEKSNEVSAEPKKIPINWVTIVTLIAAIVTIIATFISYFNSRRSKSKEKD